MSHKIFAWLGMASYLLGSAYSIFKNDNANATHMFAESACLLAIAIYIRGDHNGR